MPAKNEVIHGFSAGGITASHPENELAPMRVAPTPADAFNVRRPPLLPVACCSLFDGRFDFDSSFVKPELAQEMADLAETIKRFPGAPLSIFGHADPVGRESYNKKLSGNRTEAIYALLIRDTEMWERLYVGSVEVKGWGLQAVRLCWTRCCSTRDGRTA
jgi:outer membrane protein OmpA-like peptidoglycan-associated protein